MTRYHFDVIIMRDGMWRKGEKGIDGTRGDIVRRYGRWLIWLLLAFLLAGCQSVDPVLKVALVGPFEGEHRAIGYDAIYSARLATRQINEAGGIGGYRIGLVALDDSGNEELARQTAVSLTIDPAVVAVVGHWRPDTTGAAASIYADAGLPLLRAGAPPFDPYPPAELPADFHAAYEAVTPFAETAGPYAAPAYDAFQVIWLALSRAAATNGTIERTAVAETLNGLTYNGLTGPITLP
jgi:ABC-type branched-subunit amino acid transport system substrate-binding protein